MTSTSSSTTPLAPRCWGLLLAVLPACQGSFSFGDLATDTSGSATTMVDSTGGSATTGSADSSGDSTSTTTTATTAATTTTTAPTVPPTSVDILFVVDDSGSMGEEQGRLSAAIGALLDTLAAADIDYRLAVTTTDNGNPWCASTAADQGQLHLSSCRSRLDDFSFHGNPPTDQRYEGCLARCEHDSLTVIPTVTKNDPVAKPSPWLERTSEGSNIAGVAPVDAARCFLPQGIAGCGFESP